MATILTPSQALRRPRRLDLRAVLGGSLALLAFFGTLLAYRGATTARDVLEVTRDLPAGATLHAGDLQVAAVRLDGPTYAAVVPAAAADQVVGHTLAGPAYARQLLMRAQLAARPGLAEGQEAMVVDLPDDSAVGASFQPGDDIQVLWTPTKNGAANGASAQVLLERVRVLAVTRAPMPGVVSTAGVGAAAPTRVSALTLSLTRQQAVALAGAKVGGVLDVALLPPLEGSAS